SIRAWASPPDRWRGGRCNFRLKRICWRAGHRRQNGLEKRAHLGQLLDPDDEVPCPFELLPTRTVEEVLQPMLWRSVRRRRLQDGAPAVERLVGPVVAALQFLWRQA